MAKRNAINFSYSWDNTREQNAITFCNYKFSPGTHLADLPDYTHKKDQSELGKTFRLYGFKSAFHLNKTTREMLEILRKVAHNTKELVKSNAVLVAFITYGDNSAIWGTDTKIDFSEIQKIFSGESCEALIGKPKIYIVQAYVPRYKQTFRADTAGDRAGEIDFDNAKIKIKYTIPSEADTITLWSPLPVDPEYNQKNSTFMEKLCQRLKLYQRDNQPPPLSAIFRRAIKDTCYHLEKNHAQLMQEVDYQIPYLISMLTKQIYLKCTEHIIIDDLE